MVNEYTISISNLTGGRNRGVEALVYSTIYGIEKEFDNVRFKWKLHTNDPLYDQWRFAEFDLDACFSYLTNTPNHSRFKSVNKSVYSALGLVEKVLPGRFASFKSQTELKQSDLVICSGGDIFTSDYNNLRKHLSYPMVGRKSYLCSHTVGPFTTQDEMYFKKCLGDIDAISVREQLSYDYLNSIAGQSTRVELVADVAFSLPVDKALGLNILNKHLGLRDGEKFVALAISKGIVRYSSLNEADYLKELASFTDYLTDQGYTVVLIPHVCERNPNNNDMIICRELLDACKHPGQLRIMAYEYSALEFKSVIGYAEALVGARTHATIASMSQCVPTVSIAYSRKAYGIVKDVYGGPFSNMIVDAKELSSQGLKTAFENCLATPIDPANIDRIKHLSARNFTLARELLES